MLKKEVIYGRHKKHPVPVKAAFLDAQATLRFFMPEKRLLPLML
jgi:hypothetical protein